MWIVLIAVSVAHRPDFLSQQTFLAVTFSMAIIGVLGVGQAVVAMGGGVLDLSQPTAVVLSAYAVAQALAAGWPLPVALTLALVAGALWGLANAAIVVTGKLNPIVVTLATNFIGLAVLFLVFQVAETPIGSPLRDFGRGTFLGLPGIWWPMAIIVVVAGFLVPRTRYGRRMIAVGGNREAARSRGVSLARTRFAIFVTSGICGGMAGILLASSTGAFWPTSGSTFQLPVIAAIILAGVSLAGGRGSILLVLPAVGFLSTIPVSLVFFGLSPDWQAVFQGVVLALAVAIDGSRALRSER
jgi:ribose transport system permease protein